MTTGEIERGVAYEEIEGFWTIDGENFKEDFMLDDQALIIDVDGKGLAVVSGCAHSGVINTLRQAQKVTGVGEICAVLGGFHLSKADNERIRSTVKDLLEFAPAFVGPCHCTGDKAVDRLTEAFGDRCRPLRTGNTIEF
jgi:7,8-dihydropterin-6-yl-methyl-4-(beta-D-ribofuranosyl)aminobenzene 5'-phosphate synthase